MEKISSFRGISPMLVSVAYRPINQPTKFNTATKIMFSDGRAEASALLSFSLPAASEIVLRHHSTL